MKYVVQVLLGTMKKGIGHLELHIILLITVLLLCTLNDKCCTSYAP